MAKRAWTLDDYGESRVVRRNGLHVARVVNHTEGRWNWSGFGMERHGFDSPDAAFEDVKYMWRYQRGKPLLTFKYASGRKVEVW